MPAILLTDAECRNKKPGEKIVELWDLRVSGLCLRIMPGGIRSWTFRYRAAGSTSFRRLALGRYPEVGLSLARERAEQKRVEVSGGADPQGDRRAKRAAEGDALRFDGLADQYLARYAKLKKKSWRNDELLLQAHVRPTWGARRADAISRKDAAALLDKIALAAPASANRTQSIVGKLFNWAVDSGLLVVNPLARMAKRAKERAPKDRVLSPDEIRILWQALDGDGSVWTALRFLLLTGLRPGEVAGLPIAEVHDVEHPARARLEIAAARMKAGKAHVVPLAPLALAIVRRQLASAVDEQAHVFPAAFAGVGPTARHSLSQGLRRIVKGLPDVKRPYPTPHDLRRTVATGLAALGVAREDRLAILAHAQDDVHARHYDQYDRLAEKRSALETWEKRVAEIIAPSPPIITPAVENVVPIDAHRQRR